MKGFCRAKSYWYSWNSLWEFFSVSTVFFSWQLVTVYFPFLSLHMVLSLNLASCLLPPFQPSIAVLKCRYMRKKSFVPTLKITNVFRMFACQRNVCMPEKLKSLCFCQHVHVQRVFRFFVCFWGYKSYCFVCMVSSYRLIWISFDFQIYSMLFLFNCSCLKVDLNCALNINRWWLMNTWQFVATTSWQLYEINQDMNLAA